MSPLSPNEPRSPDGMSDLSRRRFMQVMGASFALATASGCRWEGEEILPFAQRPTGRVPGTTRRFASALDLGGGTIASLLVTSYDGRPIKIEGNPLHPLDAGAASARAQAAILDLYDPDHSSGLVQRHEGADYPRTWKEFDPWFAARMEAARTRGGAGLAVLAAPSSSRTRAALQKRFAAAFPAARWVEWTPVARTNEVEGARLAYGRPLRTHLRIENARTLVCLDADPIGEHPAALANARAFARRRNPEAETMLRTWAVESTPTLSGAAADHRLALRAEQIQPLIQALEHRVKGILGGSSSGPLSPTGTSPAGGFLAEPRVAQLLESLARELAERRGESLVVAGPRQPGLVHAIVQRLNAVLGNTGRTLVLTEEPDDVPRDPAAALGELVRAMDAGEVTELVVLGGNPVYDAPADLDLRRALRKAPLSIHLGTTRDETARACTWHLPRAHELECFGDARSWDGTLCTIQPLIAPIYERRSEIELVAAMLGAKETARELVRAAVAPDIDDAGWNKVLHDGFVAGSALVPVDAAIMSFDVPAATARALEASVANGRLELVLAPDSKLYDGRGANNAWLQELPDALTQTTWGNAARFSPATARAFGIVDGTLVRLRANGRELVCAAIIVPGNADGSVTLHLGYGRAAAGLVGGLPGEGVESVGFDAYRLRGMNALDGALDLAVELAGGTHALARTTDPHVDDEIGKHGYEERIGELLREATLASWRADPELEAHAPHHPPLESLWEREEPAGARWGMAIDLNSCTGCNACVVACQAENNVPVVGREQVMRGREMHWIRIDRHFLGEEGLERVRFQPITCQHCESAPCEQVCPVAATVHSAEGLNDMIYNRCIGTRYCANNCPFKVRRFNFFNYHKAVERQGAEVQRMIFNPEVTIRARGVMEKCTFCVQRIQAAKIQAKNAGRALKDGEVVPACAQTCPTSAIVFGDLADPASRVSRMRAAPRAYEMLAELNIRPRTSYLARITNPAAEESAHGG
ncbi:MAG: 4Fe-4S dicluster domain-containing protein [Planctomycetota bacterium]|nr:4Fe-4S dicluster domain-containing protein [Planctomycetota bacterium]